MEVRVDRQARSPYNTFSSWIAKASLTLFIVISIFLTIRALDRPMRIEGVEVYGRQNRGHDEHYEVHESDLPAVGGIHDNLFQNCGIYLSAVDTEKAIHSLEHGAVWITFHPSLPTSDISFIAEKYDDYDYLLISPFSEQKVPVAITAWGAQLTVDSVSDQRIDQFLKMYLLGPATPERGAPCQGGYGEPDL